MLSTRKTVNATPYLLIGFNENFDHDIFYRESIAGEYKTGLSMLHKLQVNPGDVFVIYGGLPHAIGPGVTMVEVMEPSDLVVVPEINCCGMLLDEAKRFSGLDKEKAMSLFDYKIYNEEELRKYISPVPEILETNQYGTGPSRFDGHY